MYKQIIINPRRAWATDLVCHSVRPSVCLLPRFLLLGATRWPISNTNRFSATLASFLKLNFL